MEQTTPILCVHCNFDTHWGCDGPEFCECDVCLERADELVVSVLR